MLTVKMGQPMAITLSRLILVTWLMVAIVQLRAEHFLQLNLPAIAAMILMDNLEGYRVERLRRPVRLSRHRVHTMEPTMSLRLPRLLGFTDFWPAVDTRKGLSLLMAFLLQKPHPPTTRVR